MRVFNIIVFVVNLLLTKKKMPILFSVVARGTVVLAKYATCAGNFTEVTEQILSKIPPHDDKLTYSHGNYLFHYIAENKLVYFCITDDVSTVIKPLLMYVICSTSRTIYSNVLILFILEISTFESISLLK